MDNIIRPLVISEHMRFHRLWVFFALLGGVQAFGVIGLFVGPAVLALAQSLFSLIREETHTQRHCPAIRPLIEKAMKEGIHYHRDLVSRVLTAAGEYSTPANP